ncbi:conserved protein of unknown function [Ruminococcaceae bacterium BL-6]|nr:conserved protein of unknown function [Ruminococcaceae bacterium BL-6]
MENQANTVKKHKKRKIAAIVCAGIVALLLVLGFSGALPYLLVRGSSAVYVSKNYPDKDFHYKKGSFEFNGPYGAYGIIYENEKGEICGLLMGPTWLPVTVNYDSLNHL